MDFERIVVVPDLHGHDEILEKCIEQYEDDVGFVFLGDVVDGSYPDRIHNTLDILAQLDERKKLLLGNHEWVLWAVLQSEPGEVRDGWYELWRGGYEHNTAAAYDIDPESVRDSPERLARAMRAAGHLSLLESAELYHEGDTFIAVHAGLSQTEAWTDQRTDLDTTLERARNGVFFAEVPQLIDFDYSNDPRAHFSTDKTLVTGHSHHSMDLRPRSTYEGKRIRLSSELRKYQPLYVWEDWTGAVVRIDH